MLLMPQRQEKDRTDERSWMATDKGPCLRSADISLFATGPDLTSLFLLERVFSNRGHGFYAILFENMLLLFKGCLFSRAAFN